MSRHSLSMLVHSKPGALAKVVLMFTGRSVEIVSLSLRPSGRCGISRLDVVVGLAEDRAVDQLVKQLDRIVDVLRVVEPTSHRDRLGA